MAEKKKTGWIILHRSVMDNDFYFKDTFTDIMAWIDLLMLANHKEGLFSMRNTRIKVERGQVGYSQKQLAERWKWSRGKVKRFLNYLKNEHMIEHINVQLDKRLKSIITITNYDHYQDGGQVKEQVNEHKTDRLRTEHGTVTNNENNENNEKQLLKAESWKKFFTEWWEIYPMRDGKKIGKAKALKILLSMPEKHYEDIYNATLNYAKDKTVNNYGIKDPERFLKNGYYKEWLKTPIAAKAKPRGVITDSYGNFISYASNAGY